MKKDTLIIPNTRRSPLLQEPDFTIKELRTSYLSMAWYPGRFLADQWMLFDYILTRNMESAKILVTDILNTTMQIQDQFPELSKYIPEMPVTLAYNNLPDITLKSLNEYHDSLKSLLFNYSMQHKALVV